MVLGDEEKKEEEPKSMAAYEEVIDALIQTKEVVIEKRMEGEQKSHYTNFTQLNNKRIDCLINLLDENPLAFKILLFIMQNMDANNALVCPHKVLEERFGISYTTVWRRIKYLKDHGYIIVIQKPGLQNTYVLTPHLAWKSSRKNMVYCKFPTNVMISDSEKNDKVDASSLIMEKGHVEIMEDKS